MAVFKSFPQEDEVRLSHTNTYERRWTGSQALHSSHLDFPNPSPTEVLQEDLISTSQVKVKADIKYSSTNCLSLEYS